MASFIALLLFLVCMFSIQTAGRQTNRICNVLDYGAVADNKTDVGPAIRDAFVNCILAGRGSTLLIPCGAFSLQSDFLLRFGENWSFQLDGYISIPGPPVNTTIGGYIMVFENAKNFTLFGTGVIDGNGVNFRNAGTASGRLIKVLNSDNVTVHGITLIDSPAYHLVLSGISNSEIYDIRIRGWHIGETDGIDVSGNNIYIHDIHVNNLDECVTTKNPTHNLTVERVFCDTSGGTAIGSINVGTNISDITYRNIYYYQTDGAASLKGGYGGTGVVTRVLYENLIIDGSVLGFELNTNWQAPPAGWVGPNNGTMEIDISYRNVVLANYIDPNRSRPAIRFICYPRSPCHLTVENVTVWSLNSTTLSYSTCSAAIGTGFCLNPTGADVTLNIPNSQIQRLVPPVPWALNAGNSVPKVCPLVATITTRRLTYEPFLVDIYY